MNASKLIVAALAALLLSAGTVAALPGQAADARRRRVTSPRPR